jgi:methylthioribulose-1-phosphate dehydratase
MVKPEGERILQTEPIPARDEIIDFAQAATLLAELGRTLYHRGWVLGTSGNLSVVVNQNPLRLAITPTGADKALLSADQIVQIDTAGKTVVGSARPSDEAGLHLTVVRVLGAKAVLHTHSIWSTILSEAYAAEGALIIEGYEMLKGLNGVRSHHHRERLPILENSQDVPALAGSVETILRDHPTTHGYLLRGHGLYTWGEDLAQAKRHLEILEFLLEVEGRRYCAAARVSKPPSS